MTKRPGWRGGKRRWRADSEKPDDTKTPEVAAGPRKCRGALAPLPNVWRQWRAQRVHCTPGLGFGRSDVRCARERSKKPQSRRGTWVARMTALRCSAATYSPESDDWRGANPSRNSGPPAVC